MKPEDFSDRFVVGTSNTAEHELRLVVALGVERALRDRAYRVDQPRIAAILREAASLLNPAPPLPTPKPWWTLKR
jgi:hypothetical protein